MSVKGKLHPLGGGETKFPFYGKYKQIMGKSSSLAYLGSVTNQYLYLATYDGSNGLSTSFASNGTNYITLTTPLYGYFRLSGGGSGRSSTGTVTLKVWLQDGSEVALDTRSVGAGSYYVLEPFYADKKNPIVKIGFTMSGCQFCKWWLWQDDKNGTIIF